ncbi:MAG: hypothetical protein GF383_04160 [Candidatus Lokiarchaeota archaeon]|nr:hypothetical protein [Candidatus Lokiarchaeota archaeon]MBD3338948.1 hypothetical protein [Candidatus Lokiarchaeota archaeon]
MTLLSPWWDTAINFILIITLDSYLKTLILIAMGFLVPLGFKLWMISFSNFFINKYKTPLLVLSGVYTILYEIYIIYSLIINPAYIGTKISTFKFEYTAIMEILKIVLLLGFIFTGLYFSMISLKEKDSEIKLKGTNLLRAFIFFTIDAVIDLLAGEIIQIVIGMTLLMLDSISFYLGYILLEKVIKIFLKLESIGKNPIPHYQFLLF